MENLLSKLDGVFGVDCDEMADPPLCSAVSELYHCLDNKLKEANKLNPLIDSSSRSQVKEKQSTDKSTGGCTTGAVPK